MKKLNFVLALSAIGCALAVVSSQHHARKLILALEQEQEQSRELEVEWGQLQLEQSTWATPVRIERIAQTKLEMSVPDSKRVVVLPRP
jgi:cell division protein FtsL